MGIHCENAHGDRGQTSTSYLGVIVLVAAIVGAVVSVGVPEAVGEGLEVAVCRVTSLVDGGDCETGSSEEDEADEGGTDDDQDPDEPSLTPREQAEAGDYVAIGDSFSSGEGAYDYDPDTDTDDNECHRSDNAYPERIGDEFDFEGNVNVVTCSGAVTDNVLGETDDDGNPELDEDGNPQGGQHGEDPQIGAITDDTSLVTIGIGGNDADWIPVILDCLKSYNSGCEENEGQIRRENMEPAADAVLEVYKKAAEQAPDDARVIGVGYPRFFPEDPTESLFELTAEVCTPRGPLPVPQACWGVHVGLTPEEQAWMNEMFQEFNNMLAEKADEAGIEFVDLYDAFDGHEYGTDDPYMNDLVTDWPDWGDCIDGLGVDVGGCVDSAVQSETAHPNAAGQEAMAEKVAEQIEDP